MRSVLQLIEEKKLSLSKDYISLRIPFHQAQSAYETIEQNTNHYESCFYLLADQHIRKVEFITYLMIDAVWVAIIKYYTGKFTLNESLIVNYVGVDARLIEKDKPTPDGNIQN